MRLGITPIRVEAITDVIKKSGMAGFKDFHYSSMVRDAAGVGYQHCEITLDLFEILPLQVDDDEIKRLKEIKNEFDLTYSAHFPIWSIELGSPNKFIRQGSIDSLVNTYNIFKKLEDDIDIYVLHPTGGFVAQLLKAEIPEEYKPLLIGLFQGYSISAIKEVIKRTKIDKKKIAIENIEYPFNGTLDIIKKLRGPKLCIDTAHFLGGYSGDVDLVEVAEKYLDITSEIHLQDYSDSGGADHAALGTGNFPSAFLKVLHEYGFKGPVNFELTFDQAKESIEYIKKHFPEFQLPSIK